MRKTFITIMLSVLTQMVFSQQEISVIPLPQKYEAVNQVFNLNQQLTIGFDMAFKDEAHYLQKQLFALSGLTSTFEQDTDKAKIVLIKTNLKSKTTGAYTINMSSDKIEIAATDDLGLANGVATLLQMTAVADGELQCWNIADEPQFAWRGFMLDESRHFFGKEKVKQLLDFMALYKLNRFHWHLSDDPGWRIEIKKYPMLAYAGGVGNHIDPNTPAAYYTQEEIKEIVSYASERKIEVIPEIDMPGHARAANRAYPEFSGGGSKAHPEFTFDPGNEKTYEYLTDILKEINVLFPSEMIHLGGDEVHFGNEQWNHNEGVQELMKREGMTELSQVEKYFMVRMADSLYAMNNKILAWDEMAEISLPTDQTVIFWWRHDRNDQLQKALDKDYPVVICPRIPFYFDFVQDDSHVSGRRWAGDFATLEKAYTFKLDDVVNKNDQSKVLGLQANMWTETVGTDQRLDFMIYPRITALAEAAWGYNNDYDAYLNRLKLQFPIYDKSNIFYFNPLEVNKQAEPKY